MHTQEKNYVRTENRKQEALDCLMTVCPLPLFLSPNISLSCSPFYSATLYLNLICFHVDMYAV